MEIQNEKISKKQHNQILKLSFYYIRIKDIFSHTLTQLLVKKSIRLFHERTNKSLSVSYDSHVFYHEYIYIISWNNYI